VSFVCYIGERKPTKQSNNLVIHLCTVAVSYHLLRTANNGIYDTSCNTRSAKIYNVYNV